MQWAKISSYQYLNLKFSDMVGVFNLNLVLGVYLNGYRLGFILLFVFQMQYFPFILPPNPLTYPLFLFFKFMAFIYLFFYFLTPTHIHPHTCTHMRAWVRTHVPKDVCITCLGYMTLLLWLFSGLTIGY